MPLTPERLRTAIVGPGYIEAVHVDVVRRVGVDVVVTVGHPGSGRTASAAAFRVSRYSDQLDDVLADLDVDIVHICASRALHDSTAPAVLERGKHLVCKKPQVIDAAQVALRNLIGRIYDVIHGGAPDYPTLVAGLRGVALVEVALRSTRERRCVAMPKLKERERT